MNTLSYLKIKFPGIASLSFISLLEYIPIVESLINFGVVQPTLSVSKPFSRSFKGRNLTKTFIKSLFVFCSSDNKASSFSFSSLVLGLSNASFPFDDKGFFGLFFILVERSFSFVTALDAFNFF